MEPLDTVRHNNKVSKIMLQEFNQDNIIAVCVVGVENPDIVEDKENRLYVLGAPNTNKMSLIAALQEAIKQLMMNPAEPIEIKSPKLPKDVN